MNLRSEFARLRASRLRDKTEDDKRTEESDDLDDSS
jgi:hypothetical protein